MKRDGHLRIAMLGHKGMPSREGGVEIVVQELSTRLAARGCDVTCFNRSGHHVSGRQYDGEHLREYKGVRLKYVPTIPKRGFAALSSSLAASLCAAFGKYNLVHFHAEGTCAMLWIPKLFGKCCIVTIHGLDWKRAKWGKLARMWLKFGERCAVRHADSIIVLSRAEQEYFRKTYGRETFYIPNGISREERREPKLIGQMFGLEKESFILYLGRLVPEKGIGNLIRAYTGLHTDKKLVIAGGTSDTIEYVRKLKKLCQGDPRIIFTDFVQGRVLEELYSNAYFFVLPSELEGMPMALLEAMSYGNCCLVSDIPECESVVGNHGITFQTGNLADLREKMQDLADHPEEVEKFKKGAAEYICDKYRWDDVVDITLQVYRESLKKSRQRT